MSRRNTFPLFLLIAGLLALTGCQAGVSKKVVFATVGSGLTGNTAKKAGNESAVAAVEMCDDYKSGEATADSRYKGKEIQVKGTIRGIRKDNKTGEPMVELKGTTDAKTGSRAVRCYFAVTEADAVSKVKKDDDVKVSGTCQGKMGTGDSFDVVLKNCKLVK